MITTSSMTKARVSPTPVMTYRLPPQTKPDGATKAGDVQRKAPGNEAKFDAGGIITQGNYRYRGGAGLWPGGGRWRSRGSMFIDYSRIIL